MWTRRGSDKPQQMLARLLPLARGDIERTVGTALSVRPLQVLAGTPTAHS